MSTFSTEEVHIKFPVKTLLCIDGEPTYESIYELMMAMYTNAAAVPTTLGGGVHVHMGLVMDPTLYATLSTTVYAVPTAPVQMVLPSRTQLVDRDTADQLYKEEKAIFDNHNTVEEVLKTQLQEAVEDICLRQIKNKYTSYLGVITRDMIKHSLDRYGKITPTSLTNNIHWFNVPMDMFQPIDAYFTKIDECI
eukprot:14114064-Ditylum_brightwellii.AAC.1